MNIVFLVNINSLFGWKEITEMETNSNQRGLLQLNERKSFNWRKFPSLNTVSMEWGKERQAASVVMAEGNFFFSLFGELKIKKTIDTNTV